MNNFPYEAIGVIHNVLQVGSKKYAPGAWQKVPARYHIEKAICHLKRMNDYKADVSYDEDHLAHALTRLAMAVAIRSKDGKTNIGR